MARELGKKLQQIREEEAAIEPIKRAKEEAETALKVCTLGGGVGAIISYM